MTDVARKGVVTDVARGGVVTDVARVGHVIAGMHPAKPWNDAVATSDWHLTTRSARAERGHPVPGSNAPKERATITASSGAWPDHTVMTCAGRPSTTLLRSTLQVVDSGSAPAMTGRTPCSTPGLAVVMARPFIALLVATGRRPLATDKRSPPALARQPLPRALAGKNRGLAACIDLSDGPPPDGQGASGHDRDSNHEDSKGRRSGGATDGYDLRHGGRRAPPADGPTGLKATPNNHRAAWCITRLQRHGLHTQAIRDFAAIATVSDRWRPLAPHNPRISVLYAGRCGKDRVSPRQGPATHRRPRHMKEHRHG